MRVPLRMHAGPPEGAHRHVNGLLDPSRYRALGVRVCPLVPIANRPLVLHVLDGLRAAGVREVAVLGDGATRAEVASVVGAGARSSPCATSTTSTAARSTPPPSPSSPRTRS